MKVDEGDKIKRGQRIAEWIPTPAVLTEVARSRSRSVEASR